jgi:hypothetical protein
VGTSASDLETPAPSASDAPASPVLDQDVSCPLCEYNLRGLTEPRCPECGYTFEWAELTDPTRRRHPILFEHYADRNLWSFRRTLWAGLRPGRFWRSLSPAQPSFPRRLAAYAFLSLAGAYAVSFTALSVLIAVLISQLNLPMGWPQASRSNPFLEVAGTLLQGAACFALWAAATFGALMVFRISMRRARIRPVHVARCVVYSFDACLAVALAVVAVAAVSVVMLVLFRDQNGWRLATVLAGAPFVLILLVIYRLVAAYRHYLRFDRPFLTILAAQLIAALFVLNVVLFFANG